jgi:hypothetical protein
VLNDNYLAWVHTATIRLGGMSKLKYVIEELPKLIPTNLNFPTVQEKIIERMEDR